MRERTNHGTRNGRGTILSVLVLAAAALIAIPAVAAMAATGEGDERTAPTGDVNRCMRRSETERPRVSAFFDELVADEVISPQQADEIRARLAGHREQACLAAAIWQRGNAISAIAEVADARPREVLGALISGDSAAGFAAAQGVDEATLIEAIMADPRSRVADMVAAGQIDRATADELLAVLESRVSELIHQSDLGPRGRGELRGIPGMFDPR